MTIVTRIAFSTKYVLVKAEINCDTLFLFHSFELLAQN
jgi:hypothetical protein